MLEKLSDNDRQSIAFQIVVLMRDVMSLAKKTEIKPTYEAAIKFLCEIKPELYEEVIKELPFKNLGDTAIFFQDKAALQTLAGIPATAVELIQIEIDELKQLLAQSTEIDDEKKNSVTKRIITLEAAKQSLRPRIISENRYLQRDFSRIDRKDFGAIFMHADDFSADFKLKKNSYLRIRLLHPDLLEHITGADLIYEQHNTINNKIRVMFLQYKIWDDGILYFSQAKNLEPQLKKMKAILCDKGYCNKPVHLLNTSDYRFPYCSAFLRPTDKIQESNEKMISTGIHIPVCTVLDWRTKGAISIDKKEIRSATLTHNVFEHLFNRGFVGSRWLTEAELEDLYKTNNILEPDESIKIYAREIIENIER